MSSRLIPPLLLVLVLTIAASAQTGGRPPTVGTTRIPTRPRAETPDWTLGSVFISGKVVLDEGSELTEPATIQTLCRGQRHTETYTDSHGNFSFEFGRRALTGGEAGLADAESSSTELAPRRSSQRDWRDCELQAVLPGFSSEQIPLISRISSLETADIGRIVLHRLGHVDGFTISKTTVFAPGSARKAFDKGREQEKKKKWDEAQQSFQKAVEIYSKYAVAWFELGRVQLQKNNPAGARHSFGEALAADPKYASPYQGLAELAMQDRQWPEVVSTTGQLLALNPVSFPQAWFLNAVGNYFLKNVDAAEKAAREGLKLDEEHKIPKLEYLLGMILVERHNYPEASQHMQQYLAEATNPSDVDEARKRLSEIARLSAAAPVQAASDSQ